MAQITVHEDELVVDVEGMDRLWALRSRLTIPLAHVRGATADPGIASEPAGWRVGGARVPGVLVAGTFRQSGDRVFWDVHDPAGAVVIELVDDEYQRLVVEVADPRATVEAVERAVSDRRCGDGPA